VNSAAFRSGSWIFPMLACRNGISFVSSSSKGATGCASVGLPRRVFVFLGRVSLKRGSLSFNDGFKVIIEIIEFHKVPWCGEP
jgi:hypothetical protein